MEKIVFIPFSGIRINNLLITFGTQRDEIHSLIGKPDQEFKRGLSSTITDFYKDKGLFILYDKNYYCEAIEFANDSNLFIGTINLLELSYSKLVEVYDEKSCKKEVEEGKGITFFDLGFGVSKTDNTDEIETVIVFSANYWD